MASFNGTLGNDNLPGTNYDDYMYGDLGNDTISGGVGDDYLDGEDGNDSILGGIGVDDIWGGSGDDTLIGGDGNDWIHGDAGSDTSVFSGSDSGLFILLYDRYAYDPEQGITYNLSLGVSEDTLVSIENVVGTSYDDVIFASGEANKIDGTGGEDIVYYGETGYFVTSVTGAAPSFTITWQTDGSIHVTNRVNGFESDVDILTNIEVVYDSEGNDSITGNAGNNYVGILGGLDTVKGGAGTDTLDFYEVVSSVEVNLTGGWADIDRDGVRETTISDVEDVNGTDSSDLLVGSSANNYFVARSGDDSLDGGAGVDTLEGGPGNDTYTVGTGDVITELNSEGVDVVASGADWTLAANFENLILAGAAVKGVGNSAPNYMYGNAIANELQGKEGNDALLGSDGDDTLSGDAGNDSLDGGIGADFLAGGAGDDAYFVDGQDSINEATDAGIDAVVASDSYTLSANLENLFIEASFASQGAGNALSNYIAGSAADNSLSGGDGADTLSGDFGHDELNGGSGADLLQGGDGDDRYLIDELDTVEELAFQGIDTVSSSNSVTLGSNIENLLLLGAASQGVGNVDANSITGNDSDNTLAGGDGADTLSGGAGNDLLQGDSGADVLRGGIGDDSYVLDAQDVAEEGDGEGVDTVITGASRSLLANIENLVLTGASAIQGSGNALANRITGNGADNSLSGGAGDDTLSGGAGADTALYSGSVTEYVFGRDGTGRLTISDTNAGNGSEGTDTLVDVESLRFADSTAVVSAGTVVSISGDASGNAIGWTGSSAILLSGNGGADNLIGGSGRDTLQGGDGNDTLAAGAGDDFLQGNAGADVLRGGIGDDSYLVDGQDSIEESADEGVDTVSTGSSHSLSAHVENLVLIGSLAIQGGGNALANQITGNGADNSLSGGAGDDTLSGGAGADAALYSGAVSDYVFARDGAGQLTVADANVGNGSEGTDTLADIESLLFADSTAGVSAGVVVSVNADAADNTIGWSGNSAILIAGNGGADSLTGSAGRDTLQGGDADDTLSGQGGDDVLDGGSGIDTAVLAGASSGYRFSAGSSGEILVTGDNGVDTLKRVERVVFGDGSISVNFNSVPDSSYSEARVNTTTSGDQYEPSIAGLADGGYVVAWFSPSQGGMYLQRYDASGAPVGAETRVNTAAESTYQAPEITPLTDGGYAVSWHYLNQPEGNYYDVYVQRFDADGAPVGVETRANTFVNDSQAIQSITGLPDGGFVVVWGSLNQDGSDWGIYSQRYDVDGARVGVETRVNTTVAEVQVRGVVAVLEDGGYVISWMSGSRSNDNYEVYVQRYDAAGLKAGSEVLVNSTVAALQGFPSISGLSDGGFVVAWQSAGQDGSGYGIYVQRYDAAGATVGVETRVNTTNSGDQGNPVVTALTDGGFVVTWESNGQDASGYGIFMQRYDAGGVPLGGEVQVNTTTQGDQRGPAAVTALANGDYVVTWSSDAQDGNGLGVYARRFDGGGQEIQILGDGQANSILWTSPESTLLAGSQGDDTLSAATGSDTLDGGQGADTMSGGAGDDTYIVDNILDGVYETVSAFDATDAGGTDTVRASVGFTLGANVENLVLEGSEALAATGNALDNVVSGNAGSNLLDGGAGANTLRGGAGDDTYVVAGAGDVVTEGTNAGTDTVRVLVNYTLTANVENLVLAGTGELAATGNTLANVLTGNAQDNVLDGGAGADTLRGGAGNDTYKVAGTGDVVTEGTDSGVDIVRSLISYTLSSNVENLLLEGTAALTGTGNTLANVLMGNAGNNVLDGGAGADTLRGGAGDDTYKVAGAGDVVTEGTAAGVDTVRSSVSYTLSSNVENLLLEGTGALNGTGNTLANVLTGNAGNNVLDGGAGADTLRGGAGDDTYKVAGAGDAVTESTGAGVDTVRASVSYTLGSNVENLLLEGTGALNGTGNTLANVLTGNAGNNVLDGGAGADTLRGGAGDDVYKVSAAGDQVTENLDGGLDTVRTSVGYTLNSNVENLVLEGTAVRGAGNLGSNTLTGNASGNVLDGRAGDDVLFGGQGADTLSGGEGRDRIHLGSDADVDVFVFRALADGVTGDLRDLVYEFQSGEDKVDLRLIDANDGIAGNQAFAYKAGPAAHAVWVEGVSNTTVFGDVNGDAVADFEFQLVGVSSVTAADFML